MNRRRFLAAAGLTPFFLPSLARAASPPRRPGLLVYTTSHGTVYDQWSMHPKAGPADRDAGFDLPGLDPARWSPILAALAPHARRLLVVDGLANVAGLLAPVAPHDASNAATLTGRVAAPPPRGGTGVPDGPSIDQVLAETSPCPIGSLEYAVGGMAVHFDAAGEPLPYESDPLAAFGRLFPGWDDAGALDARVRLRQQSVLDLVQDRYGAIAGRLSGDDRRKLEAHRDLVRDLEGDLATLAALRGTCGDPDAPADLLDRADPAYSATAARSFFHLARIALSCGFTDLVGIRHDDVTNDAIGAPPGDLHNDDAHAVATDPTAEAVMVDYHRFQSERFAELLDLLDAVPDEAGTLLDRTVAWWNNELGTGDHHFAAVPVVLAGGGPLAWGRYQRYAARATVTGAQGTERVGPPHNRLLVTLARALGTELEAVGETDFATDAGGRLDATRPLDELLA